MGAERGKREGHGEMGQGLIRHEDADCARGVTTGNCIEACRISEQSCIHVPGG